MQLIRAIITEFTMWFIWLGLFALLQRRLCRRFPGIRSLCRNAFLATMVVAILPGLWILVHAPHTGPRLLVLLNHYFAIGVYAQTALRAIIQLKWLALSPIRAGLPLPPTGASLATEGQLLATLVAMSQSLRRADPNRQDDD